MPLKHLMVLLLAGSALAAVLILGTTHEIGTLLLGLCIAGLCYGALIAVYPVAVSREFGEADASRHL